MTWHVEKTKDLQKMLKLLTFKFKSALQSLDSVSCGFMAPHSLIKHCRLSSKVAGFSWYAMLFRVTHKKSSGVRSDEEAAQV
jgi:hypothetical protein